jgi:hypothetical protein
MSHSLWAGKQEEDKLQTGPVYVITAIVVAIMICTYEGVHHYIARTAELAPTHVTMTESRRIPISTNGEPLPNSQIPQFGMLHQTLFGMVSDAKDLKAATTEHLNSYGWTDEKKTTAHIPIERAMQLVEQQKKQGK